jgi:hypothetical protein
MDDKKATIVGDTRSDVAHVTRLSMTMTAVCRYENRYARWTVSGGYSRSRLGEEQLEAYVDASRKKQQEQEDE